MANRRAKSSPEPRKARLPSPTYSQTQKELQRLYKLPKDLPRTVKELPFASKPYSRLTPKQKALFIIAQRRDYRREDEGFRSVRAQEQYRKLHRIKDIGEFSKAFFQKVKAKREYITARVEAIQRPHIATPQLSPKIKAVRRQTARPTVRHKEKWIAYTLRKRGLPKQFLDKNHITEKELDRARSGILPKQVQKKLRKAYEQTQYSRLRKAGLKPIQAKAVSKKLPAEVSISRQQMKLYAEEIILRKFDKLPQSQRSLQRATRKVLDDMARANYTVDEWASFAMWYAKNNTPLSRAQWASIRRQGAEKQKRKEQAIKDREKYGR